MARELDENGIAKYGEVVHRRPTPDEMIEDGTELTRIRRELGDYRAIIDDIASRYEYALGKQLRDVSGCLTASIVMLHDPARHLPRWGAEKKDKLARPELFVLRDGFGDELQEKAFESSTLMRSLMDGEVIPIGGRKQPDAEVPSP